MPSCASRQGPYKALWGSLRRQPEGGGMLNRLIQAGRQQTQAAEAIGGKLLPPHVSRSDCLIDRWLVLLLLPAAPLPPGGI